MIFPGDMHWPYIHDSLAMGVIESLIGKGQTAQDNQENSSKMVGFILSLSQLDDAPATLNEVNEEHGESHQQKDVYESAEGVGSDHTEKPKSEQHDENGPEHCPSNLTRGRGVQRLWRTGKWTCLFPGQPMVSERQRQVCSVKHTWAISRWRGWVPERTKSGRVAVIEVCQLGFPD